MLALFIGGLGNGAVIAMVAVGMVLIFRSTAIVNFAQGEFLMVGAYAYLGAASLVAFGPFIDSLFQAAVAVFAGGIAGFVLYVVCRFVLQRQDELSISIGTLALQTLMQACARWMFTDVPRGAEPWLFGERVFKLHNISVSTNALVILASTVVVVGVLLICFRYTAHGKAMAAVAENVQEAALSGLPVERYLVLSCVLGGAIAGFGGVLLSPLTGVFPQMSRDVLLPAFVAAVIGGFTSLPGALVGGLLLGVIQTIAVVYLGGTLRDVATFTILLIILWGWPEGIFKARSLRKA